MNIHSNSLRSQIEGHKIRDIVFISLLCVGTLVPSSSVEVSMIEIIGMLVSLTGGVLYLLFNQDRLRNIPRVLYLFFFALIWSLFDLFKESPGAYARNIFGPVMLLFCIIIGTCIREKNWPYVITILIIICFCGLCRDMCVDLFRINIGIKEPSKVAWAAGVRGRALARSMFPLYLTVLSAPLVFLPGQKRRIIGALLLGMSLWTGIIMGCGRGVTLMSVTCIGLAARTRTQRVALVVIPVILISILGIGWLSQNEYTSLLYDKFANIDESRPKGRISQVRYAVNVLGESSILELLTGAPRPLVKYENVTIHNLYLGLALRYGITCAVFYGLFWLIAFSKAMTICLRPGNLKIWHLQAALMGIAIFIYSLVSGHLRWRECVISGCLIGLLLRITQENKEKRIGTHYNSLAYTNHEKNNQNRKEL